MHYYMSTVEGAGSGKLGLKNASSSRLSHHQITRILCNSNIQQHIAVLCEQEESIAC